MPKSGSTAAEMIVNMACQAAKTRRSHAAGSPYENDIHKSKR